MKIEFQHTAIGYQSAFIQDICLAAESPMLVGLVGDNGVGKSTLLRTICGLVPPLSGEIAFNGTPLSQLDTNTLSRYITFLPNSKSFYLNLTVQELLSLSAETNTLFRVDAKSLSSYVLELISLFGLEDLKQRKLVSLSDGQYQLVSIVFALARQTEIVLLDEPLAFLDFNNRKRFMEIFAELVQKENRLIIFSSHDLAVLHKCNQLWHLSNKELTVVNEQDISIFCRQLMA
ncbi:MAG: ABC transporter ATP-binding protein [Chitinophagales bacterium]|jgi:iron complex transport system ATP-binding protein|nr:ABC transporter ATP-binding protein [Chitinophagales bacterium]